MKRKWLIIGGVVLLLLVIVFLVFIRPRLDHPSGAAGNDLRKALESLLGSEYKEKLIAEEEQDGHRIRLYESLEFDVKYEGRKKWLGKSPKTFQYGCLAKVTRYTLIDDGDKRYTETSHTITFKGYDDGDLNSIARAAIDEASREEKYSDSREFFNDTDLQLEKAVQAFTK